MGENLIPGTEGGDGVPDSGEPSTEPVQTVAENTEIAELKVLMHELLDLFNARLRYDARKDEVIQKLTEQVNQLSRESRQAEKAPLLHDVILLTDSITRLKASLMRKERWETAELVGPFEVILAEATEVLERQDVVEWVPTGDRQVDRKFQRALSTVATSDPNADGEVVEVIRRGYVLNGGLFRPQEVSVARHKPGPVGGEQ